MNRSETAFEYVNRFAEQFIREGNIPGLAIAITDRQKLLWTATYGMADLSAQTSITTNTLFEIGSLAKPFTSIALLQMRDQGKLDLRAPVSQYLPWFQPQSDYPPITVHHLMNHTAGLIRGTDVAPHGLYESWALRKTRTAYAQGEYFWYSNVGYKTLGFLIEELAGQPLHEVIQSRVLDPLGMTQSYPAVTYETRKKAAIGYTPFYDDRPEHPSHGLAPFIWAEYGTGDGCVVSTVEDMARYLRMLLNLGECSRGRIMSEESFSLMTGPGVWTGGDYYGYGLASYNVGGCTYIGHGGGNAGFRSAIVVDLEAGLGVVFLLNLMGETDPIVEAAQHVLTIVRAQHRGENLPPSPPVIDPITVSNAADYVGSYRNADQQLNFRASKGNLLLAYQDASIVLEQRGPDRFYVGHPDFELFLLEFKRESGKVVEAFHGADWYTNDNYTGPRSFDYPREWNSYCGHYRARNPEASNFRVLIRKDCLYLIYPWGQVEPLVPLTDNAFRVSDDERSPERLVFKAVAEGRALRADYSACPYYRTFTK